MQVAHRTQQPLGMQPSELASDPAIQPRLRYSLDLESNSVPTVERDQARQMWGSLNLEPEEMLARELERKQLLANSVKLEQEVAAARSEATALKAQLIEQEQQRFHHPAIYTAAAALAGVGVWLLFERRKRMQLLEREMDALAAQSTSDFAALPPITAATASTEEPQLAADFLPAHDAQALDTHVQAQASVSPADEAVDGLAVSASEVDNPLVGMPTVGTSPLGSETVDPPHEAPLDDLHKPAQAKPSLIGQTKRVLAHFFSWKSLRQALRSSHRETPSRSQVVNDKEAYSNITAQDYAESSQWGIDQEAQLAFAQELQAEQTRREHSTNRYLTVSEAGQQAVEAYNSKYLVSFDAAHEVEHLMELRTAVNGLRVLGRPEGAARLLGEHLDAHPDTCAWAYLQLMQVYELLNKRQEFERVRTRYRTQFNRMAPYWLEPNSSVLGIDGYARALSELIATWARGRQPSLELLRTWLVGSMDNRKIVQLPAYDDLFDLYELLDYVDEQSPSNVPSQPRLDSSNAAFCANQSLAQSDDFVPTVSLLDLDYEFSSDIKFEEKDVAQAERVATIAKTGHFSVDFNVAGTEQGSLPSAPAHTAQK